MNGAQPVHRVTEQRGPVCGSAFAACVWIITQPDFLAWRWEPVPPADMPAEAADLFNPLSLVTKNQTA